MSGTLFGIGVGPGDPELISLKAHRILTSAKVVAYPAPDDGPSFARSIVAEYLSPKQTEIEIIVPMRVARFPAQDVYDKAADDIAEYLKSGEDVVVLCEGDPFFYGSFMYLFERLSDKFPVEIVPGISSLMASAAALQRPLAARNDVLTIIPGPLNEEAMLAQLEMCDAAAIIKVGRHFDRIRDTISKAGLLNNAGYLERVTLPNQQVIALGDVDAGKAPYFSIILIYKGAENWVQKQKVPTQISPDALGDAGE
ncbi:MAG: precorrin-2 C(20)-methyltransferase [Hyphomicrobiales bacterium]|nr:precorrin-2 C(20)-methyltransferase [Hyphomicrobiales bacterium]PCH51711.1 MAG: precorrin-2 C(20)-methyltransferase [Hyphomicrobiales bacterium]